MTAAPLETVADDSDLVENLSGISPFQDLPESILQLVADLCVRRSYDAGQTVFSLGQYDGADFLAVLSGAVRVSVTHSDSGAISIEDIGKGGVVGLEIALTGAEQPVFQNVAVTAEEDSTIVLIDAAAFKSLAAGRPSLMRNVALYLSHRLVAQRFQVQAPQTSPEQRVYDVLLQFVRQDAETGAWRIEKMPKHRELADRAGVDDAEAAEAVATLIQLGVAQRDYPGLLIKDIARLNQLAV